MLEKTTQWPSAEIDCCVAAELPFACAPAIVSDTRDVVPVDLSWTKTSPVLLVSSPTRVVAPDGNVT
jgi:hypothetical protein